MAAYPSLMLLTIIIYYYNLLAPFSSTAHQGLPTKITSCVRRERDETKSESITHCARPADSKPPSIMAMI